MHVVGGGGVHVVGQPRCRISAILPASICPVGRQRIFSSCGKNWTFHHKLAFPSLLSREQFEGSSLTQIFIKKFVFFKNTTINTTICVKKIFGQFAFQKFGEAAIFIKKLFLLVLIHLFALKIQSNILMYISKPDISRRKEIEIDRRHELEIHPVPTEQK